MVKSVAVLTVTSLKLMLIFKQLFATAGTRLWEPVMWLEVVCSHEMMEKVVRDLSSKRAHIEKISAARNNEEVSKPDYHAIIGSSCI